MSFLGDIAGDLVGGALGFLGQSSANSANAAASKADRDFQREVLQNRHQWEADDYEKAGFNRILSVTSSAGGTGSNAAIAAQNALDPLASGVSSAVQTRLRSKELNEQINQMRSQTAKNYADADKADADYDLARSQSKYYKTLEDYQDTQSMVAEFMLPWQIEQMKQNIVNSAKVSDAQVIELLAGAGAHSAVADEARERTRGYRRDNDALAKVGDVGKFFNDVGEASLGKRATSYIRGFLNGLPSFDWSPQKEFEKYRKLYTGR